MKTLKQKAAIRALATHLACSEEEIRPRYSNYYVYIVGTEEYTVRQDSDEYGDFYLEQLHLNEYIYFRSSFLERFTPVWGGVIDCIVANMSAEDASEAILSMVESCDKGIELTKEAKARLSNGEHLGRIQAPTISVLVDGVEYHICRVK